jgi:hypothetical protein
MRILFVNETCYRRSMGSCYSQKDKTHRRQCKMLASKKITCKETLRPVFTCLTLKPRTLLHCIRVYTVYLFTQGRWGRGRVEPESRLEGQQFTKLGRKYQHD